MDRRRKGVFSLLKGSSCRLFLYGTDGETNVALLAAVRGDDIVSVASSKEAVIHTLAAE
jgi:hypothetical protein